MDDRLKILVALDPEDDAKLLAKINKKLRHIAEKVELVPMKFQIDDKAIKEATKNIDVLKKTMNTKTTGATPIAKEVTEVAKAIEVAKGKSEELQKNQTQLRESLTQLGYTFDKYVGSVRGALDAEGKLRTVTTEYTKGAGEKLTVIDKIDNATQQVVSRQMQYTDNVAKATAATQKENRAKVEYMKSLGTQLTQEKQLTWEKAQSAEAIQKWATRVYGASAQLTQLGGVTEKAGNSVRKFSISVKDGENYTKRMDFNVDSLTKSTHLFNESLRPTVHRMLGWVTQMGIAIQRSIQWGAAMALLYGNLRRISEGIQFLKDLDKDLTQVAIITGQTREETQQLAQTYAQLGMEMAKTVREISHVNTELIRQGLTLAESEQRLRTVLQLSSSANMEVGESLKFITSAVNALGVDAEAAADMALKASQITASSVPEVAEAFTKTASAARATGVEMSELGAIISGLVEVTQESPSSLGNSLKTLIARFNQINEETGELNEDINRVGKAFASAGVQFSDADGQIRPLYELLTDLSLVWDGLDKNTQMYIGTMAAGQRQMNRFLAIMDNFGRVQEINNELVDSGGTLLGSYDTYLGSVEASANQAAVAFEQMFMNAMNSDAIRYWYDAGTAIFQLIDKIGGLNVAIGVVIGSFVAANKQLRLFITGMNVATITEFVSSLTRAGAATGALSEAVRISSGSWIDATYRATTAATATTGYGLSAIFANEATKKLLATMAMAGKIAAFIVVVGLLVKALIQAAGAAKRAREEQEKLQASLTKQAQNTVQVEKLLKRQEELNKVKYKTAEQNLELLDIQRQIAELMPEAISGYDDEYNAIAENARITAELVREKKELLALELVSYLKTETEALEDNAKALEEQREKVDELKRGMQGLQQITVAAPGQGKDGVLRVLSQEEVAAAFREELAILEEMEKGSRKYQEVQNQLIQISKDLAGETLLKTAAFSESEEAQSRAIAGIAEYTGSMLLAEKVLAAYIAETKEATTVNDEYKDSLQEVRDILDYGVTEGLDNVSQAIEDNKKNVELLSKAEDELENQQSLGIQTMIDLQKTYGDLNEIEEFSIETLRAYIQAKKDQEATSVQTQINMERAAISGARRRIQAYEQEIAALNKLWGVNNDFMQQGHKHVSAAAIAFYDNLTISINESNRELDDQLRYLDELEAQIGKGGSTTSNKAAAAKTATVYAALYDHYKTLDNSIKALNNSLAENAHALELANDEEKISLLKQQNDLYIQQAANYQKLADAYRTERAELEKSLSAQGFTFAGEGDDRTIQNLENIKGKTKEVEEAFQRYIDLGLSGIPEVEQAMRGLQISIRDVGAEIDRIKLETLSTQFADMTKHTSKALEEIRHQLGLLDDTTDNFNIRNQLIASGLVVLQEELEMTEQAFALLHAELASGAINQEQFIILEEQLIQQQRRIQNEIRAMEKQRHQEAQRIADAHIAKLKAGYQQDKKNAIDAINDKLKAEEDAHKAKIKMLDDELSRYNDIIDAKLESIDREEDQRTYEQELIQLQQERGEIQDQINVLSLDDSLEARNKIFALTEQLDDKDKEIGELQHNRNVDLRKQNLTDLKDAKTKEIEETKEAENAKFDAFKENLEAQRAMVESEWDARINDETYFNNLREQLTQQHLANTQALHDQFTQEWLAKQESAYHRLATMLAELQAQQAAMANMEMNMPQYEPGWGGSGAWGPDGGTDAGGEQRYNTNRGEEGGQYSETRNSIIDRQGKRYRDLIAQKNQHWADIVLDETRRVLGEPNFTFAKGGETDTTGLHWLDGKRGKPERILSPEQTQHFGKLVDWLPSLTKLTSHNIPETKSTGGLYIDTLLKIEGNVDEKAMPDLKRVVDQAVKQMQEIQRKNFVKSGIVSGVR